MNNSAAILRALIIYAICIPLALVVGYAVVCWAMRRLIQTLP